MLGVAEALGNGLEFPRVDPYESAGRVVFGELTVYPVEAERSRPNSTGSSPGLGATQARPLTPHGRYLFEP